MSKQIPLDPKHRQSWIVYQLHRQGTSLAEIGRSLGVSRFAPSQALRRPYPRMEVAIAEALGLSPQALFPERYPNEDQTCPHVDRSSV